MNPNQILMNQIQMQLKANNPQKFKMFQEMSGKNPQEILNKMTGNYTEEQRQAFGKFAKGFGITDEQLSKYGINTK